MKITILRHKTKLSQRWHILDKGKSLCSTDFIVINNPKYEVAEVTTDDTRRFCYNCLNLHRKIFRLKESLGTIKNGTPRQKVYDFLSNYHGHHPFLISIKKQMAQKGINALSDKQVAACLKFINSPRPSSAAYELDETYRKMFS